MADRTYLVATIVFCLAVLASHVAGSTLFLDQLWGVHAYAFLAPAILPIASVLLGAAAIALPFSSRMLERRLGALPDPTQWSRGRRVLGAVLLFAVATAIAWLARAGHTILGDGNPLTKSVTRGEWFHRDSPLTAMLHHVVYRASAGVFAAHTKDALEVARLSVALDSAIAGGLFALVAWALAGELCAAGAAAKRPAATMPGVRALVFLLLLTQGYVQLFCGYVENYTWLTLGLALYLWLALRTLRDPRAPLLLPGVALLLAIGCHLVAAVLLPSFALLAGLCLARREGRTASLASLVVLGGLAILGVRALAAAGGGYDVVRQLLAMTQTASAGEGDRTPLFSALHLGEFLNEQALIGPLGLFLFLPAALGALLARRGAWQTASFVLLLGLSYLGASFVPRDLRLGYARDWDLFAPAGLIFTVCGLWLALGQIDRRKTLAVVLPLWLAASLYHTAPWIAVNSSFHRSLARLKVLPLGGGRTESLVGYWYARQGDVEQAHRWLETAIRVNPENLPAYLILAELEMDEGRFTEAAYAYWAAGQLRPSFVSYRLSEAYALLRGGRSDLALHALDLAPESARDDARVFGLRGMALWEEMRADEAHAQLERAITVDPRWAKVRDRLATPGGYATTLVEDVEPLLAGAK